MGRRSRGGRGVVEGGSERCFCLQFSVLVASVLWFVEPRPAKDDEWNGNRRRQCRRSHPCASHSRSLSNGFWSSACNCFFSRGSMRVTRCMGCKGAGISGSISRRVSVQPTTRIAWQSHENAKAGRKGTSRPQDFPDCHSASRTFRCKCPYRRQK